jgi:phage terminase large subunit GpA-like protein
VSGKAIDYTGLAARREYYKAEVPMKALLLTAGVDVQENRIEIEVVGWGSGEESWSIDYQVFLGDTLLADVWEKLDEFLLRSWAHESGKFMRLSAVGVDSGFRAKVVYNFCKLREHRRIFPVKGRPGWGLGLINRPKKRIAEHRVFLFLAYVDEIKSKIYGQLRVEREEDGSTGPGYCHFPIKDQYDPDHFQKLTAERTEPRRVLGRMLIGWVLPTGRRNEPLDCRCYAIAALNIVNPNFDLLRSRLLGQMPNATHRKVRRQVSPGVS